MPDSKNALLRYKVLDRCFSDPNEDYDFEDLLNEVNAALDDYRTDKEIDKGVDRGINIRQLRADIKFMREFYDVDIIAVPYKGKKCYYRYSESDFSIFNNEMSVEELDKLRSTIEMLGKFRGVANNEWLEEVISNLEYRFGVKSNKNNVVSFEQNSKLKGLEFLSELIDSTASRTPLQIVYKPYKGDEYTFVFHPYHLKQYNSRWFLIGLEENSKYGPSITNKALDRIVKFSKLTEVKFIPNEDIDFATYFDDIIGVTKYDGVKREKILLKFDAARFPYVVSKPIHLSQEIVNEAECTVSINVRPNNELEAKILEYGPQVEVLEPKWFRDKIAKKIEESYNKYFAV